MITFNIGDKPPFLDPTLEVAVSGEFSPGDTVEVRLIGTITPIMGFQAIYLSTGSYV